MGTLGRTWELVKESFAVLLADKEILLFPVLSSIAAILVSVTFLVPLHQIGAFEAMEQGRGETVDYILLFFWYYLSYFVIIFFNSGLVACANIRLSGGDPTVRDGLRIAFGRLDRILVWALVAATVGLILRTLEQRSRRLGRLVISLLGLGWTLITYFIVPVIIFENRSVFDSIRRSSELFRRNWGEQVAGGFGFGLLFFLLALPGLALGVLGSGIHLIAGIALAVIYFLVLSAVGAAVKGIFTVALYRYATQGEVPAGFSKHLVQGAFTAPTSRWR
jgi:hypothetical protein